MDSNNHPNSNNEEELDAEEVKQPEWFITQLQRQFLETKLNQAIMEHAMAIPAWDMPTPIVAAANAAGRTRIQVLQELLESSMTIQSPNL